MDSNLISAILSWIPMFILIGAWIYMMRKTGYLGKPGGLSAPQYYSAFLAEQKRHNEALEKILTRLAER